MFSLIIKKVNKNVPSKHHTVRFLTFFVHQVDSKDSLLNPLLVGAKVTHYSCVQCSLQRVGNRLTPNFSFHHYLFERMIIYFFCIQKLF